MFKIIKATCTTTSTDHKYGSVKVTSPKYWVESSLLPVVNNISLRKGDNVAVLLTDDTSIMSGIVLGRLRDATYKSHSNDISGKDIIFEADDFVVVADDDTWTFNNGIEPLLNYSKVLEALRAIEADLIPAMGGKTLSTLLNNPAWIESLQDKKIKH